MALAEIEDARHALAVLGKVDFDALPSALRAEVTEALPALAAQLSGVTASAVGAYDGNLDWAARGHRTPVVALRHRCRMRHGDAAALVRLARALRDMPATHDALRSGSITEAHARRLTRAASRPEFPEAEEFLLGKATTLSYRDFDTAVAYWEQVVDENRERDPDPADPRETARELHVSKTIGGMGRVDGWLDPIGHAAFREALRRIERELFDADWEQAKKEHGAAVTVDRLWRTPPQRRADALVEMAERAVAAPPDGKRPLPLVIVHTDPATMETALRRLAGGEHVEVDPTAQRLCELDDGTVVSPTQMLEQALIGHCRRLVYGADGVILDYGRTVRLFRGALREAICARDRTCDHDGCEIPARHCEIDHIVAWDDGGETGHRNGRARCSFHHRRSKPGC